MSLHPRKTFFTSGRLLTLVIGLAVFGLLKLGFWQLQRANWKQALLNEQQLHRQQAPLSFEALLRLHAKQSVSFYPVRMKGRFDFSHILLLEQQFYQHQLGYRVIVPFLPQIVSDGDDNDRQLVLVEWGWVAKSDWPATYQRLLHRNPVASILAEVKPIQRPGFFLGEWQTNPGRWPAKIQSLAFPKLEKAVGGSIFPFMVRLKAQDPLSLTPIEQVVTVPPQRHKSYALQWFSLAALLLIGYGAVVFKEFRR